MIILCLLSYVVFEKFKNSDNLKMKIMNSKWIGNSMKGIYLTK